MTSQGRTVRVALIQDQPIFFDKKRSLEKMADLVLKASRSQPQLIVFPESFIPGYPRGLDFGTVVGARTEDGRKLYKKYHSESILLEGPDRTLLEDLAAKSGAYIIVGATERHVTNGSLYCSMMYISPDKGLMGVHRKIKPTGQERVIWAESDASTLVTFDTDIGIMGGLICWENYMPLARMAMYSKGVEIYIAPTADSRDNWSATMRHIALEGRCFVLGCNQFVPKNAYPPEFDKNLSYNDSSYCRGGSIIVSPSGEIIEGPVYDKAQILIADLDLSAIIEQKLDFDPVGHYSRPDIFHFSVPNQPPTLTFKKDMLE